MLAELVSGAAADAAARQKIRSLPQVEAAALAAPPPRDALASLAPTNCVKIIAEIKRASPSRGALASIPDVGALASAYEQGGASAISVLTEERRFSGSLADLSQVRETCTIPVLCKDFLTDPYQIFEARAAGADLVLLIVAALTDPQLDELFTLTKELGMCALVETHTADEVRRAIDTGAQLIGVNARDLNTFTLDKNLFARLAELFPEGIIRVAESAVTTPEDVAHYRSAGADVVLIGEALVTGENPRETLHSFLAA